MSSTQQKISELLSPSVVHTAVLNATASRGYLKKLLSAAFATILRKRTTLDGGLFRNHNFNGIDYNMFSVTTTSQIVRKFRCWTKGAFHALERDYLHHLYLVFTKLDDPTDVIESYKFKFAYSTDATTSAITSTDLTQMTTFFLESLYGLDMCEVLEPDKFSPFVIITYRKDTPEDYHPPCHRNKELKASTILNSLSTGGKTFLDLEHILTGFHSVKCRVQGKLFVSDEYDFSNTSTNTLDETSDNDSLDESRNSSAIDCTCNLNKMYNLINTVQCDNCKSLKHAPCVQYFSTTPDTYLCDKCQNSATLIPGELQQETSIYRLAVAFAYYHRIVPLDVLDSAPPQCKSFVLKKLVKRKVLAYDGIKYHLDQNQLDIAALEVFETNTDTNIDVICTRE